MKKINFRDEIGRYTKSPSLTKEIYWILKMTYLTGLTMGFCLVSILTLHATIWEESYKVSNIAVNELETIVLDEKTLSQGTIREVTMYSSTPEQTDASPCIAANGQDICVLWKTGQNLCATNAFPLGTELQIDKLGSCLVVDRMNRRFSERIDWYAGYDDECLDGVGKGDDCPNYRRAWNFGKQNLLTIKK
jgi:hypothetical protein